MTELAIRAENVTKVYRLGAKEQRQDSLINALLKNGSKPDCEVPQEHDDLEYMTLCRFIFEEKANRQAVRSVWELRPHELSSRACQ